VAHEIRISGWSKMQFLIRVHTKETRGAKWDEIEKWSGFGEKTNIMMAVFAF